MNKPTIKNPKIKFVKKAKMWVKTYFELNEHDRSWKQVQVWTMEKPT